MCVTKLPLSPPQTLLVCESVHWDSILHRNMGIDLKSGGRRVGHNERKEPKSKNVYLKLLEKLFRCLTLPVCQSILAVISILNVLMFYSCLVDKIT